MIVVPRSGVWSKSKSVDDSFRAIYEKEWKWRQKEGLGMGDEVEKGGIKPYLPRVDAATQSGRLKYWKAILAEVDEIDSSNLSASEQINYGVYRAQIMVFINSQKYRDYEKPLSGDTAFWSNLASASRDSFASKDDYLKYISQLQDLPRYFNDQTANMKAGLKRGFTPPQVTLIGRDSTIISVAESKPEDTSYYRPFKLMPDNVSSEEQEKLRSKALSVIEKMVIPSYKKLLTFFRDDYFPNARTDLAAESLPDGKAYYKSKITEFTTTSYTPKEIHQIGLDEMASIKAEMEEIIKAVDFKGDFAAFLKYLRTDGSFYAKTAKEYLKDAAYIAKKFDGVSAEYFGRLPRQRFAIKEVPLDMAPFYTSGRGGADVYWVNTYDLPSRGLYSLPALTLHESAPGHSFQLSTVQELKAVPPFRHVYISAFGEGWGLYCERLGTEMEIYETPYEVFGMLSYQAWRACRLVVDTGIHALGWTREQAQQYINDNTALSTHEIETEVDRYISWPGQALAYYLGMMEIKRARAKAEKALGSKFNIRAFHDAILSTGSVPLEILESNIDEFISNGGVGPYPEYES